MDINNLLILLSKKQKDWIKMSRSFGASLEESQDMVQEMYISIFDSVKDPDRIMYTETEVNTCFIYVTLRNIYYKNYNKSKNNVSISEFQYDLQDDVPEPMDEDLDINKLKSIVDKTVGGFKWYKRKIWTLYHDENYKIKTLSEQTGISKSSLNCLVNDCKKRIRKEIEKEF